MSEDLVKRVVTYLATNDAVSGADALLAEMSDEILRLRGQIASARKGVTELAAECHRFKWQFDLSEDYRPTATVARAMIPKAFDALHRIGDAAMKLRSALTDEKST